MAGLAQPTRRGPYDCWVARGLVVVLMSALAACASPSDNAADAGTLAFTSAGGGPSNPDGVVFSVTIENFGEGAVSIERIVRLITDPGLEATYLGWATCEPICAGGVRYDGHGRELAQNSLKGTLPVPLPPVSELRGQDGGLVAPGVGPPKLVFLLRQRPGGPGADLREGDCLKLRQIVADVEPGGTTPIEFRGGGYVAALYAEGSRSAGCTHESLRGGTSAGG